MRPPAPPPPPPPRWEGDLAPVPAWWKVAYCLVILGSSFIAGALFAAGCEWPGPVAPRPEPATVPTTEPPESWCQAACARWQMAGCKEGFDVCEEFSPDGECSRMVSCLAACEADPHAYPTGPCVADPPAGAGPMQDCEQVRVACPDR